jgi:hypothetical protein
MDAKIAFTLLLIALMILPAVAVAGYRYRRAIRERDRQKGDNFPLPGGERRAPPRSGGR